MSTIKRLLLDGAKYSLPLLVTLLILFWILIGLEHFFRELFIPFIPAAYYIPGMGWVGFFILLAFFGLISHLRVVKETRRYLLGRLKRLPLLKSIFAISNDVSNYFFKNALGGRKVVLVKTNVGKLVGFVTREDFSDFPKNYTEENEIAVYLPMSYQIGGYTVLVPRDQTEPVDLTIEEGMAITMSAHISRSSDKEEK